MSHILGPARLGSVLVKRLVEHFGFALEVPVILNQLGEPRRELGVVESVPY